MSDYQLANYLYSPFGEYISPLSWWDMSQRKIGLYREKESAFYQEHTAGIVPGTKLARHLKISMLDKELEECETVPTWEDKFSEILGVIDTCEHLEHIYYLGTVADFVNHYCPIPLTKDIIYERLRSRYPMFAGFFHYKGYYGQTMLNSKR